MISERTESQFVLLQRVKDAYANGTGDLCIGPLEEYDAMCLEEAGYVRTTAPCYIMITDAGRAALKDGGK